MLLALNKIVIELRKCSAFLLIAEQGYGIVIGMSQARATLSQGGQAAPGSRFASRGELSPRRATFLALLPQAL